MNKTTLPVLVLKNIILFPFSEVRLELDKDKEKELISLAESYYNKHLLIVHQKDILDDEININDIPTIGVVANINMKIELPNKIMRLVIRGIERVKINNTYKEDDIFMCDITRIKENKIDYLEEMAYSRSLIKQLEFYIEEDAGMSNSVLSEIMGVNNLDKLTDILTVNIPGTYERKLEYLYQKNPKERVAMLLDDITYELKVLKLEQELEEKVNIAIDDSQRDYILQEKLKAIKEELNLSFDKETEIDNIRLKITNLKASSHVKEKLNEELNKYEITPITSPEIAIIRNYIDWLLNLPWETITKDNKDLNKALDILNKTHYGLDKVKDRIIEYLALIQNTNNANSPIICLVGPPGVGKTSLAKSIAKSMNRNYTKISVGGVNDQAEIVGHRKAYMGSSPGRIISGMKKAKSINPVFVIDEIDKMTIDLKGDPASALLEVLDKEQNNEFLDNYLEVPYDLSKVMFICTANYADYIPLELKDRLEIIEINSYTEYEKINIAKEHLIPKNLETHNLSNITFTNDAILKIITSYTKEAGVRELDRQIANILRKIVKENILSKTNKTNKITDKNIDTYLGTPKYIEHEYQNDAKVGIINGLSYNIYGGDTLKIEVTYYPGKGDIITTGSLGEVFKESAILALSYIKSNAKALNIDYKLIKENDIHLHVPEGAVKKDGPSAGIAITTAIISALKNKAIPGHIALTGEMTLRGEILPIGGLKEKVIGAKKRNITKIFIPKDNTKDLEELDKEIKDNIEFVKVTNYKEILKEVF